MRNRLMVLGTLSLGVLTFTLAVRAQAPRRRDSTESGRERQAGGPVRRLGARRQARRHRSEPQHLRHPRREAGTGRRHPVPAVGARKDDVREDVDRTDPQFGNTTDPQVLYCEPPGVPHIYLWPIKHQVHPDAGGGVHPPRARSVLSRRLVEQQASRRSGSAVVGTLDRLVRERRHAGRGHGRLH